MPETSEQLKGAQGLVTFESPDLGSALSAAEATARELVERENWGADIFTAAPEGARWTADELNQQLLHQQAYEPQGDVRVLIIAGAHLMDARLHDHLLKIVEEPVAPVLFAFVVDDSTKLPVTLQSRIYRSITVPPRSTEELVAAITQTAGTAPSPAVVRLSQMAPVFSAGITGDAAADVLPLAEQYVAHLQHTGFTAAFRTAKTLKEMSKAVSGGSAEAPKTKAAQREAVRVGLQLVEAMLLRSLETGTTEQALVASSRLGRVSKAQGLAASHLPADQVFAYALTGGSDAAL